MSLILVLHTVMERLPLELQRTIYEFDPTYRQMFSYKVLNTMMIAIAVRDAIEELFPALLMCKRTEKYFLRTIRKAQLREVARIMGIRLGRRVTKHRALMRLCFEFFLAKCQLVLKT